ncbi:Serine/threonine protein kinase [Acidovorax soli]|uniref:non-specific serine/threonine protein kinase n=2 Tax=Acidovorax soli TaxID=592050 RepID=A0A1H4D744_9BURK|nr:Serine/threonine protein kinase [Acidovorax soli]
MMIENPSPTPASRVNHVDALTPGTRLAEFEILQLLGVGGFGMVYKAFDHSLHRAVAIKEYMPSALAGRSQGQSLWVRSSSEQQAFQAGLASFMGEARLLAQFDHPSLVKVFRFWEANNTAYMVMPLYTGMTLKQARAQMRTPPPEAWLRKMLWSVLGALRVLHEGHTLHRDISPDNIFLQDNGPPVLLDLGAARHAINDQGHKHTAVLKVNYAPIEQYSEGDDELRQGPWSDLYSLAAVVHGCLCNDTPLPATLRSIRDRMVPFSRVAKTVQRQFGVQYSAPFVAAIAQALALRPEDRPQSIDAFLQTMGMTSPPEGVEHFDFRAELGGIWAESADRPGTGVTAPIVSAVSASKKMADLEDLTYRSERPELPPAGLGVRDHPAAAGLDTVAAGMADTVFMDVGDSVFGDPPSMGTAPAEQPSRAERSEQKQKRTRKAPGIGAQRTGRAAAGPRSRWPSPSVWLAGILLTLGAAAGASWWTQGQSTSQRPAGDMLTELKDPLAVPAALQLAVPANPTGDTPLAGEGDQSAVAVAGGPGGVPVAPAAAEAAVAHPAVRLPAQRRTLPGSSSATAVAVQEVSAPEPVVAPRPRAPVVRTMGPEEACADAGMLARPLCIFNECKKPGLATHPVCVDVHRRQEAEEQRRQMPN